MKLAIYGASGKMGKELVALAKNDEKINLIYEFTSKNNNFDKLFQADLIIDFSTPVASKQLLMKASLLEKKPILLVGTTGLNEEYFELAKNYNASFFYSSNTSLGVALLNELVKTAATMLKDFDVEILEMHHNQKVDAPSGTALTLANTAKTYLSKARNEQVNLVFNRTEKRNKNEIGMASLRGGNVAGYHNVGFYSNDESVQLIHNANSRAIFAIGAIKIAKWLINQKTAHYTMGDFVNYLMQK